jgi:hypothetical protein
VAADQQKKRAESGGQLGGSALLIRILMVIGMGFLIVSVITRFGEQDGEPTMEASKTRKAVEWKECQATMALLAKIIAYQ